ncbi:hypothetical protein FNV43_RR07286 [Rhamnella rubrinervis]|uniref:Phospholipid/glycerol acyltransferase domain-containing protein n=1 Tax=Rhamnella rubrinervis TaxID=2594499 RepID=A0A8K0MMK0_9ROSA|nr:hypothetical protein FNV43_RR07286 [Rhamnella rubrinervis]
MDLLRTGASVFFFPEGTRSKDGKLGAFKKGAFSVAAKTKVPVVPITLIGTGKLMPAGMEGILNSGSVKVVIHKPIEGSDPEILCNATRSIISEALNYKFLSLYFASKFVCGSICKWFSDDRLILNGLCFFPYYIAIDVLPS